MHRIPIYQIDAFADEPFTGNPAAVVPLEGDWLPDRLMQQIAMENNLAETAFLIRREEGYGIRWFTPTTEVDLCGHATLASAYVVSRFLRPGAPGSGSAEEVVFHSYLSGRLPVTVSPAPAGAEGRAASVDVTLDFPADRIAPLPAPAGSAAALGVDEGEILEVYRGQSDLMYVLGSADTIGTLEPDLSALAKLPARGVIVTALAGGGRAAADGPAPPDFVSRFFAPQSGIPEDPVTGSAHTTMAPYWAGKLGRGRLLARQVSPRGGTLRCEIAGERVRISGAARLYLEGAIVLEE